MIAASLTPGPVIRPSGVTGVMDSVVVVAGVVVTAAAVGEGRSSAESHAEVRQASATPAINSRTAR